MKFHNPPAREADQHAPANTLGIRRVAFAVDGRRHRLAGTAVLAGDEPVKRDGHVEDQPPLRLGGHAMTR
jgi:hypothetical protein